MQNLKDMPVVTVGQIHRFRESALCEIDELSAQGEVMRKFVEQMANQRIEPYFAKLAIAVLLTAPSDALREVRALAVEDAKEEFFRYKNHTSDELLVDTAIQLLDDLSTSIMKGG